MLALITGLLVAACSSPSPREPSTNTPATRQSNAPNQSNPSNTTGFNPTNPSAANQDNTPNQNVSPPTADAGSANPPAASQNSPSTPAALPGTEEFGLSREGLVKSIETVESLIARCMSDAGFEYIAVDYNTVRRGMTADKSLPGYSDREYLAQFGYGLSTLYTGLPPQLSDVLTPAKIGLGEQNVRIFNDLSPADQVAYNHTLFGEYADATFAVALETEDFSRAGGCTRAGIEQVFGSEVLNLTYYSPLDALLQQDPRMIEALAQFANCMRDAGFNYSNPNDVEPDIRKRLYDITQGAPPEALSSDARSALAELQGEERAVAVVAENCTIRIIEPIEDQVMRELYAAPVR
ncbi:MAG: hypothetical protein HY870_14150 [Chloroflexi bacterium]|nr:hypothetical protein [Chloroflexota bacterium]